MHILETGPDWPTGGIIGVADYAITTKKLANYYAITPKKLANSYAMKKRFRTN